MNPNKDPETGKFTKPSTTPAATPPEDDDPTPMPEVQEERSSPEVATPAADAAAPAPAPASHPSSLVKMAQDFGILPSMIQRASTEELSGMVADAHENYQRQLNHWAQQQSQHQGQPTPAPEPVDEFALDPTFKDDYGEPITQVIQTRDKKLKALEDLLKQQQEHARKQDEYIGRLVHAEVSRQQQTVAQKIEAKFSANPERYGESHEKLDPKSDEFQRRVAVFGLAQSWGDRAGTMEERIDRADRILFGGQAASPAPVPVKANAAQSVLDARKKEFAEAALATPAGRAEVQKQGKAAAIAGINDWLRNDRDLNGQAENFEDDLPG